MRASDWLRATVIGAALFMLVCFASLLSGARGAILAVPAMVLMMMLLEGVSMRMGVLLPADNKRVELVSRGGVLASAMVRVVELRSAW